MARVMKDTCVEWLGEIPDTWDTIKFKYLFSITGGNGFPESIQGQTEGTYPFCKVSDINGHSDYVSTAANYVTDEVVEIHSFNIIPCGSIIIAKIGAALQKNHRKINSVPCCIDNNTQALVPVRADNIRYLFYLTHCIDMGWFDNNSTVPSLNNNKLLNFFVPNVDVAEQHRIADFLDRKCAEIDAVIEKTKATIEEYKKLKQSVITEAVTKGIRGNRPMKDSGIEWIGEIPEGWVCMKLKYIIDTLNSGTAITNDKLSDADDESVYPVYGGGSLIGFYHDFNAECTLLVGRVGAKCGCITFVPGKAWATDNALVVNTQWNIPWLNYVLIASDLNKLNTSNAQPLITASKVLNLHVAVCEEAEQQEIVTYLNDKCAALDTLIAKKTALLTELETYKKSLIYEYVTGKKEVNEQ